MARKLEEIFGSPSKAEAPTKKMRPLEAIFTTEEPVVEEPVVGTEVEPMEDERPTSFRPSGEALTQTERQAEAEKSFGFIPEAVTNIPSSGVEFGKALITPVLHPVQTAKSIGELARGLFSKLIPGEQPSEAAANALGDFLKERYGSIEGIKQTVAKDPVGFMSDLSLVFTAGGTAGIKGAQIAGKTSGITSKTAKAIAAIGRSVEPINLATAPLKVVAKATPQQFINRIFESSAKFTTKLPEIERTKIVNTALNDGIVLSRSGLKKLHRVKRNLLDSVDDIIDEGVASGRGKGVVIKTEDMISQLDGLKDFLLSHPLGADFVDKVDNFSDTLRRNPKLGTEMTLKQAQKTKKILGEFFDQNLDAFTKVTHAAEDAIRRGIKTSLEDTFPEIRNLNKKASELIALEEVLEPAIARIRNRDIFGLGSKLFAAGGLDAPSRFLTTLSETILGDPKVKSRLAIALNRAKKKPITPDDIGRLMKSRMGAFQAGRLEDIMMRKEETPVEGK